MALVNPALMSLVTTGASLVSMTTGNPLVAAAAKKVQLGAIGASFASQLASRPKITAYGSGRSPHGNSSSGSDEGPQLRSINTNAVTAIIRNLETIILRIETSNSYLKNIAMEISPKAKQQMMNQFADQNRKLFELYNTRLGRIFIDSFGKDFFNKTYKMNKVFGKSLQDGSVTNSQLMMFKVFGDIPFFKNFFGNIRDVIENAQKERREDLKLTITTVIPGKLDGILHLLRTQNEILLDTKSLFGRFATAIVGSRILRSKSTSNDNNITNLIKLIKNQEKDNDEYRDYMYRTMSDAMDLFGDLNKNIVSFRGALFNIIGKPLGMLKTILTWFIRYKVVSSFIAPFVGSFSQTQTAKSAKEKYYKGSFLEKGVNTAIGVKKGLKMAMDDKENPNDPNSPNRSNAFVEFLRSQGKKVSEYYKNISKQQWFIDLMSSIKHAFLTGITNIMKTITMVIIGYQTARSTFKILRGYLTKGLVSFKKWLIGSLGDIQSSFREGLGIGRRHPFNPLAAINPKETWINIKNFGHEINSGFRDNMASIAYGRRNREVANRLEDIIDYQINTRSDRILNAQKNLRNLQNKYTDQFGNFIEGKGISQNQYNSQVRATTNAIKAMSGEIKGLRGLISNINPNDPKSLGEVAGRLGVDPSKMAGPSNRLEKFFESLHKDGIIKTMFKPIRRMFHGGLKGILATAKHGIGSFTKALRHPIKSLGTFGKAASKAIRDINLSNAMDIGTKGIGGGIKGAAKIVGKSVMGIGKFLSKAIGGIFGAASKLLGFVGIAAMVATAVKTGIKMLFSFASKDKDIMASKSNGEFIKKAISKLFSFFVSAIFKALGLIFNGSLWKALIGGIWEGIKSLWRYTGAAILGGLMSVFLGWWSMGRKFTGWVLNKIGLGKEWKTISSAFSEGRKDINLTEQAKKAQEEDPDDPSLQYQKQIAENTKQVADYFSEKAIAEKAGKAVKSVGDILGGIVKGLGGDIEKYNKRNQEIADNIVANNAEGTFGHHLGIGMGGKNPNESDSTGVSVVRPKVDPNLSLASTPSGAVIGDQQKGDPVTAKSPTNEIINSLKKSIKISEGKKLSRYIDSLGYPTIGYGHKLRPGENYTSISEAEANKIFDSDYDRIYAQISSNNIFRSSDPLTQAVLMDLSFNMGPGFLSKFPKFSTAISQKDFNTASKELLDSAYARQVGKRALRNAAALRSGIFYEDRMNPKIRELLSDQIGYPPRNGPKVSEPTNEEVLKWLKPISSDVTNDKILALNPYLKYNLVNYAKERGRVLEVTSALRTRAEQEALYKKKGGVGVAKPGHSRHESGFAIDINSKSGLLDTNLLAKHNLHRPVKNEPWHVELTAGGRKGAPSSSTFTGSDPSAYGMSTENNNVTDDGGKDVINSFIDTFLTIFTGQNKISSGQVTSQIGDPTPVDSVMMQYPQLRKLVNIITRREMDTNFDIMENESSITGNKIGNKVKSIGDVISNPINTAAKCMVKVAEFMTSDKSNGVSNNKLDNTTNLVTNVSPTTVMSSNNSVSNGGNSGNDIANTGGIMDMGLMAFMI